MSDKKDFENNYEKTEDAWPIGVELVELLVVAHGQLQVARVDARLLVVTRRIACQLQNLRRQVLQHGGQIDGRTGTHTLGVVALAQQTVDAANWELESSLGRSGDGSCAA